MIFYQATISISIIAAFFFFSKKTGFLVAIGWTIWTFLFVFAPWLKLLQLGIIWGTFLFVAVLRRKNEEIEKLKAATMDYPERTKHLIQGAKRDGKVKPLQDSDHYSFLISSLRGSRSSFLVLSGWVSEKVVDDVFY